MIIKCLSCSEICANLCSSFSVFTLFFNQWKTCQLMGENFFFLVIYLTLVTLWLIGPFLCYHLLNLIICFVKCNNEGWKNLLFPLPPLYASKITTGGGKWFSMPPPQRRIVDIWKIDLLENFVADRWIIGWIKAEKLLLKALLEKKVIKH